MTSIRNNAPLRCADDESKDPVRCRARGGCFPVRGECVDQPGCVCRSLHKFAKQDAYWHHGSGWVFPRDIGPFKLRGSATQLDGNDDVSGEYLMEQNGAPTTAFVEVYYPTSAAVGAKLDTARAAILSRAGKGCEPSESAREVHGRQASRHRWIEGRLRAEVRKGCALSELYFFRTPNWVITVRAIAPAKDRTVGKALDTFVQGLRWDTLDTDPMEHDPSP